MKTRKVIGTACLLAMTLTAFSQTLASRTFSPATNQESLKSDIVQPEFSGLAECKNFQDFLNEHLHIPDYLRNCELMAPLAIRFTVLPNRDISDIQIIQGIVPDFDEAVLEVLNSSNNMWNPGMINGQIVPMEQEMTVILNTSTKSVNELYKSAQWDKIRADKLLKKGKYNRAIKYYSRSIESVPSFEQSIYQRGLAKYYVDDIEGALNDFERVAVLNSHLAENMLAKFIEMADSANRELQANTIINR